MGNNESKRLSVVRSLIEVTKPLSEIADDLTAFEWDYEGEGVELTRHSVANILKRFMSGKLSVNDVERWANLVESREDIFIIPDDEEKVSEAIYELANPSLAQPLNQKTADQLLQKLETR